MIYLPNPVQFKVPVLAFIFTLLSTLCYSQAGENIFYDTLSKVSKEGFIHSGIAEGKYIYLSGSSFSEKSPVPTLLKMDTAGNTIWTAADYDNYGRYGNYTGYGENLASSSGTIKSGNYLFTIVKAYATNNPDEIWCISDSTGALLWKTKVNDAVIKIADYSSSELLVITGNYLFQYHVIDKTTGKIVFTRQYGTSGGLGARANIFVDAGKNILLSWDDTCKKFRDSHLNNLLWTSHVPNNGSLTLIHTVAQDSGRYIFMGKNNARAVDSLTGNTIWAKRVNVGFVIGVQSGNDGVPKSFVIKDSLLYVTWAADVVGAGGNRNFTLTRFNTGNGSVGYNVSHDFNGIPVDPAPPFVGELDWPYSLSMDVNNQLYITGSYDYSSGPENPGNWGIMKVDWQSGAKIYEATITDDSTARSSLSKGKFLYYFDNKFYCAGNIQKKGSNFYTKPVIVRFDTASVFKEGYRVSPDYTFRYPSALVAFENFSTQKLLLLKKVGRAAVLEMRSATNGLVWSKSFVKPGKFIVPHLLKNLGDSAIAVSYHMFAENADTKVLRGNSDSLFFVKLDSTGNQVSYNAIKINNADSVKPMSVYTDKFGKTNFIYLSKDGGLAFAPYGYMLNGSATRISGVSISEYSSYAQLPKLKVPRVQHFGNDTMVIFRSGDPGAGFANLGFLSSTSQSATNGYQPFGVKQIQNFVKVFSSIKLDSVSHFIMGKNINGTILGARYNYRLATALVWAAASTNQGTMLHADTSASSIYTIADKGGNLLVSKLNKQTGLPAWDFEKTAAPGLELIPQDITYNRQMENFTTGGTIIDSATAGNKNSYFLITLDSANNIIRNITRQGYGIGETVVTAAASLKTGPTVYGGSVGTSEYGTAGFYVLDCFNANLTASVSIIASANNICYGTAVTFTATPVNGGATPSYQWQVNGINTGNNSNTFTASTLNNNDQVKVILTGSLLCASPAVTASNSITMSVTATPVAKAGNDTSVCTGGSVQLNGTGGNNYLWTPATGLSNPLIANPIASPSVTTVYVLTVFNNTCSSKDTVVVSVNQPSAPTITISGSNTICAGNMATFTAAATNTGLNPIYQWQVNGINAGISSNVFTSSSLNSNDQVKVMLTSNSSCATTPNASSNTISVSVQQLAVPLILLNNKTFTITNPDAGATYTWQILTNNIWVNVVPTVTGITYTAAVPGEYRVMGVKGPCTSYSISQVSNFTNRIAANNPFGIYLYPNPATNIITLDSIKLNQQWETVDIITADGKHVLPTLNIKNKTTVSIDINALRNGSYFVQLRKKDGEFTTIKFVKQ